VSEPFAVVNVAEMRALEAAALEAGTPERVLQERAGLAVADVIEEELAASGEGAGRAARIVVLIGAGNNGRDAVVAGRRLAARGCDVHMWYGSRCPLSESELRDLRAESIDFSLFDDDFSPWASQALFAMVQDADYVIDGLLGVGSRGAMREEMASVATVVMSARWGSRHRVVGVDVPSGIDADTGAVPGEVVLADVTVTFGAVKAGLLQFPAASYVGRLVPKPIGLPAGSADRHPVHILDEAVVRPLLPGRALDAHKYTVGRVLVVAGSDRFVGAACLGSEAAARAGAGLVGVVSTEAVKRVLATRLPEATYPLTLADLESRPDQAAADVAALLPEQAVLLLGPGIDRTAGTDRFVRVLLTANAGHDRPTPAVIDADALTLLAGWPGWWEQIGAGNVLTPHAGEMSRLLASDPDLGSAENEAPWETARRAASRWKQVIVLKGSFTAVAEPGGRAWVYPHPNPALATAGTGDVLVGLMSGLLPQCSSPLNAARVAVVAHAHAARRLVDSGGMRTIVASDLLPELPVVIGEI
jgi:NAD(P)H-hydrate epimerase